MGRHNEVGFIAVLPTGYGADCAIAPEDSILTYTTRNAGHDTAFRVVVVDTLSADLDLTSLVLGPAALSSGTYTVRVGASRGAVARAVEFAR
jgi:uncharacterized repeat protein (TIGR01451 family)